jgi:glycosyltransferase involved in cell wall biosynthesis
MENKSNVDISVVMPVYNGEKYLKETIDSVLAQTFENYEFIIADDGSTDKTPQIIATYSDKRIKYFRCRHNYIQTLNTAMKMAKAPFIARIDADDRMMPQRLQVQRDFLMANPDIDICGSWFKTFGEGESYIHKTIGDPEEIKIALLTTNPMAHPTVMLRRLCIDELIAIDSAGPYRPEYIYAEDYYLWCELSALGHSISNIQQCLLEYRFSDKQVTRVHHSVMRRHARAVQNFWCMQVAREMTNAIPRMLALWNELFRLANEKIISFQTLLEIATSLYRAFRKLSCKK